MTAPGIDAPEGSLSGAPQAALQPPIPSSTPGVVRAFPRLPLSVSVSESRQDAAKRVTAALRLDPNYVVWSYVPALRTAALVIYAPWSRVVIARTTSGSHRFADDWRAGRCSWLLDALLAVYPVEAAPPLPLARLRELPSENATLTSFVRWATRTGRVGWRAMPGVRVIGSWRTYRDAVVVREGDLYTVRTRQ